MKEVIEALEQWPVISVKRLNMAIEKRREDSVCDVYELYYILMKQDHEGNPAYLACIKCDEGEMEFIDPFSYKTGNLFRRRMYDKSKVVPALGRGLSDRGDNKGGEPGYMG